MQVRKVSLFLRFAVLAAGLLGGASLGSAQQSTPAPAASPAPLQAFTAPDGSVSAGIPAGWKVTKAVNGIIQMSGPKGEGINLGIAEYARNGAFQPNQKPSGFIAITMPYQSTLTQKVEAIFQQAIATGSDPTARISLTSAKPIPLGNIAQCGNFLGNQTNAKGPADWEMRFCSLPMDSNGIYKLVWLVAVIPVSLVNQDRATAEAVLNSYRPSPATLKLLLQPSTPPRPPMNVVVPGGGPGMSPGEYAEHSADQNSTCFDEGVLRQEPEWQLPPYCR